MKILIADQFEDEPVQKLKGIGCDVHLDASLDGDVLAKTVAEFGPEILVVRSTKIPGGMIAEFPPIKAIIRAGAGYDNIDTGAAGAAGIAVCNCPGMNAAAVAELTMAHLLCCDRRIPEQTALLKAGHWNKKEYSKARGLKGLRLGVVGAGAIGQEVIARARAFGMHVSAWSRYMTPEKGAEFGVTPCGTTRAELLAMVRECDAVTIHVAATSETKHLCDREFFETLPQGAYFVNTSRGSVVDEDALIEAMRTRGIRAGLDVYADQPAEKDCQWRPTLAESSGAASLTHHVGASTDQAQSAVGDETVRIVETIMHERRFLHCVNEQDLAAASA